jgi:23S rRNA (adenine1618-N6)-methyltransferase
MKQQTNKPSPRASSGMRGESGSPFHPRNRHQGRYDFLKLTRSSPELNAYLIKTPRNETSIDFKNPLAVRALNRALLKCDYGLSQWDIPEGFLCPPIPGRADYLHGLADLLAESRNGKAPCDASIRALDIGVGANCIYPLLGHAEYGWQFVGSEIDPLALRAAQANIDANGLAQVIELRHQRDRGSIFSGVVRESDRFDLTLCNPPFHASAREAAQGSERKWRNLQARPQRANASPALNFGGQSNELWCSGGEVAFLRRMIGESASYARQVHWFSSLVAKSDHLPAIRKQLLKVGAKDVRVVAMAQGSKQSRFIAWTFQSDAPARAPT